MARIPQVTRTIQTTEVNLLCMNVVTAEPFNQVIILPRTYKDEKAILKAARVRIETDEIKVVHVVETAIKQTRYGMTEEKFIECADILPALGEKEDEE